MRFVLVSVAFVYVWLVNVCLSFVFVWLVNVCLLCFYASLFGCILVILCCYVCWLLHWSYEHVCIGFSHVYVLCGSACSVSPLVVLCALCFLIIGLLGFTVLGLFSFSGPSPYLFCSSVCRGFCSPNCSHKVNVCDSFWHFFGVA